MNTGATQSTNSNSGMSSYWRHAVLLVIVIGSFALIMNRAPVSQDPQYHNFADARTFLGIPNCFDVASNLPFLLVGLAGLRLCRRADFQGSAAIWSIFFIGVTLVTFGSAYYHWQPGNDALFWDRLPMTIGFMAMFAALVGEWINEKMGRLLVVPAVLAGIASVLYWRISGDLRFYAWVQLIPLLTIPVIMALFRCRYSHQGYLLLALGCYLLAKVFEFYDRAIFGLTHGLVGGHAIKHLFAGLCCFMIFEMLHRRKPAQAPAA